MCDACNPFISTTFGSRSGYTITNLMSRSVRKKNNVYDGDFHASYYESDLRKITIAHKRFISLTRCLLRSEKINRI